MIELGELEPLLDLAHRAALRGGEVVRAGAGSPPAADEKGAGDYVTEVDRRSEAAIGSVLGEGAPDIPVIGEEETGDRAAPSLGPEPSWVVDPLDGTTNFVHRFPIVGVSVALVAEGRPVLGVVHAPFLGETYLAARGLGAFGLAGDGGRRELRVSDRTPDRAVVGTGFPFRDPRRIPRYVAAFGAAMERFEDLRRPGAAALDLAWVAAGVFDGFFELGLSAWDVAAGAVLIEEAGGRVTDWSGGAAYLSGDILAGPPSIHAALLEVAAASGSRSS